MLNNVAMPSSALGTIPSPTVQPTGGGPSSAANRSYVQAAQPSARLDGTQWFGVNKLICARDLLASLLNRSTRASWDVIKNISCESVDPQTGKIDFPDGRTQLKLAGGALSLLTAYLDLRQQHGHSQNGPLFIATRSNETKALTAQTLGMRARTLRSKLDAGAADAAPADLKSLYLTAIASAASITVRATRPADAREANAEFPSAGAGDAAAAAIEGLAAEGLIGLRNSPGPQAADQYLMPIPDPLFSKFRQALKRRLGSEGAPGPALPPLLDNWASVPRDGMVRLLQRAGFQPTHALACSGDSAALQQHLGQANLSALLAPSPDRHRTPLHHAVEGGQLDNVKKLVDAIKQSPNPDAINYKDSTGMTPLHLAGNLGQMDAFKTLLAAGGNLQATNIPGSSVTEDAISEMALHLAQKYRTEKQREQQLEQDQSKKRSLSEFLNNTDRR